MPKKSDDEKCVLELFSQRLSDLIEERKIKQKKLSEATGISEASISGYVKYYKDEKYDDEKRIPKSPQYSNVIKIAKYFNVTLDYLFGLTDDPNQKPSAVDDLGLSPKAIGRIENINTNCVVYNYDDQIENGAYTDMLVILDSLLTSKYFNSFIIGFAQSIYHEKKSPMALSLVLEDRPETRESIRKLNPDDSEVKAATQSLLAWECLRRIVKEVAEKEENNHGKA